MKSITSEERAAYRIVSEISDISSSRELSRKNKLAILEAIRDTLNEMILDLKMEPPDKAFSLNGIKSGKM